MEFWNFASLKVETENKGVADTLISDGRMDEEHRLASFWNRSSKPEEVNMLAFVHSEATGLYDHMIIGA